MKRILAILLFATVFVGCEKSDKIYKIGDLYQEHGKRGIVFYTTDEGRHGKIVSLDETQCAWAADDVFELPEAYDCLDGMVNMKAVRSIPDWKNKYPAFAWCADKGDGWYLPAQTELLNLYITHIMEKYYGEKYYWSSTSAKYLGEPEIWAWSHNYRAYTVDMYSGGLDGRYKSSEQYVRAIAKF